MRENQMVVFNVRDIKNKPKKIFYELRENLGKIAAIVLRHVQKTRPENTKSHRLIGNKFKFNKEIEENLKTIQSILYKNKITRSIIFNCDEIPIYMEINKQTIIYLKLMMLRPQFSDLKLGANVEKFTLSQVCRLVVDVKLII